MKIEVYQSGGFTGEQVKLKSLDTATIKAIDQEKLNRLISQSQFFNLNQQEVASRSMGSDMILYEIDIADDIENRSLKFVKSDATLALNELLEFILTIH